MSELAEAVRDTDTEAALAPLVRVFNREGEAVSLVQPPEIVIEPETFLADGGDLPTARKIGDWLAQYGSAAAVEIRFPKFTDGRGFSVAARLREGGYKGDLHATGAISQDLVFHLRRVGFTHFHLENPGVERIERSVLEPFSGYYQAAADGSRAYWQGLT